MEVHNPIPSGTRVRIEQSITKRDKSWVCTIEGLVLRHTAEKTGSWFAREKDDKLWLNRVRLRKDDGEETTVVLDRYSRVTILQRPA